MITDSHPTADISEEELSDADRLLPLVYDNLKRMAAAKLAAERPNHTLQATALVHEVYCRVRKQCEQSQWHGPDHFLAAASEAMRRILVDHARRKLAAKRGGGQNQFPLDSLAIELPMDPADLLDVHEALDRFAAEDPLAAELIKLRVFSGFSHIEAARHLGLTKSKGDRVWAFAKARLCLLMAEHGQQPVREEPAAAGSREDEAQLFPLLPSDGGAFCA